MNNKEAGFERFVNREDEVNPELVWGSSQKVIEIVGLGSGRGFELKGINLPKNWNESIDNLKNIHIDKLQDYNQGICKKWNFSLEKTVLDHNNVLKEMVIKNKDDELSRLVLAEFGIEQQRGQYLADGLNKIEPVMIFQEIMADYLDFGWGDDFDYGHILCDPKRSMGSGFSPLDLEVPKDFFESREILTNEYFQKELINRAFNITGRFGMNLEDLSFDKRGLLTSVAVSGDRTCYYLEEFGSRDNKYVSHNVDNAYQAAALHTIVASYINFLLKKR